MKLDDKLKVGAVSVGTAGAFTVAAGIAFMGARTAYPLAGVAALAGVAGFVGYRAPSNSPLRGLLYGAAFLPAFLTAGSTFDLIERTMNKNKQLAQGDSKLAAAKAKL